MQKKKEFNILITHEIFDKFEEYLVRLSRPGFNWYGVDFDKRPANFDALLAKADCVVAKKDLTAEDYRKAKRLKLFQLPIAGYDMIDLKRAKQLSIAVANNGGANAISVAEHVILLALSLFRNLLFHHQTVLNGEFTNLKHQNIELAEKSMGIVGLGNIGKQVALRAKAFGMQVAYYDIRRQPPGFIAENDLQFLPFPRLMEKSDIVTFHVPLTSATHHMVDAESLSWMREQAILINTSRGEVVDETALAEVLSQGRIKGAGLDVFAQEPLPLQSPLLSLQNVVLTPHCGPSYETQYRMLEIVAANIVRFAEGYPAQHVAIDYENLPPEEVHPGL